MLTLALLAALAPAGPPQDARASSEWWVANYGRLTRAESPLVDTAETILDRLWRSAGQRLGLPPRLLVLARDRPDLLAIALPDNTIVVSRSALEFCLRPPRKDGAPGSSGEARLSLVLAHELDHIFGDDDWHIAGFADDPVDVAGPPNVGGSRDVRYAAELRADANAVLLMAAAGFDPSVALSSASFLEDWATARQLAWEGQSATHPDVQRRARLMRREVERLAAGIPVFQRGVAQMKSGDAQAALDSFDAFARQTRYAGKELLNNVGLAYLQLGTRALVACGSREPARFRISTWVDERAPLTGVRLRGHGLEPCGQSGEARRLLEAAITRLRDAVAGDPTYLPAYLNLIAVLVVGGRVPEAYAQASVLESGRVGRLIDSLPPSDLRRVAASNASSVCEYLTRRALGASTEEPISALRALEVANPGDPAVLYNLARTLQETGRAPEARDAWSRYLRLDARGPFSAAARDALEALGEGSELILDATAWGKDSS